MNKQIPKDRAVITIKCRAELKERLNMIAEKRDTPLSQLVKDVLMQYVSETSK
jgi:predicted transcriptional regulator